MLVKKPKNIFFIIFSIIVMIFMFVAPYVILPLIYANRDIWGDNISRDAVFLELWQIDTFEGGSSSRARFLEKSAFAYHDKTGNIYVLVRSISPEQSYLMLENGSRPDMVSFGIGVGEILKPIITPNDKKYQVRSDILLGGMDEGNQLAVPWCMGGYVLCSQNESNLQIDSLISQREKNEKSIFGTGFADNVPNNALPKHANSNAYFCQDRMSQYLAYEKFLLNNSFSVLLGTQRDFYRLSNKVKLGAIKNITFSYLSDYTDLVQYISITTQDSNLVNNCTEFIDYILTDKVQTNLSDIGLFSVKDKFIYNDSEYKDFETAVMTKKNVLNVFTSMPKIREMQQKAVNG